MTRPGWGLHRFESCSCRYVASKVLNTKAGLQIEHVSCWLGLHCFESHPCSHVVSEVLNIKVRLQI